MNIAERFERVEYSALNSKQKEVRNFHHVAAALVEYGFASYKLDDDWQGADFLAYHMLTGETLKIQLKGRVSIAKKYLGKDICMAFPLDNQWCVVSHDELYDAINRLIPTFTDSKTWSEQGTRTMKRPSKKLHAFLAPYLI